MSSASFAPLGASLFAMEVVLGNFSLDILAPVFVLLYHAGIVQLDGTVIVESPHPALLPLMSIAGVLLLTVTMDLARGIGYLHGQLAKTLLVATRDPD